MSLKIYPAHLRCDLLVKWDDHPRETIADIVADLREWADNHAAIGPSALRDIADRIEAAHKREVEDAERRGNHAATKAICETLDKVGPLYDAESVGNAAKMREALEYIAHYCDSEYGMDDPGCADGHILADKAIAALAAPPRNCDVGTAEEQMKRQYDTMCNTTKACPDSDWSCKECFAKWAQMPYGKGGAK